MLINAGRILMLLVWAFLLFNLIHPYPKPLTYFVNVALFFMVVMHGLQVVLMRTTQPKGAQKLSGLMQLKVFFFGVFELLAWQKKHFPKQ